MFIDEFDANARGFGFVGDVLARLAMRPQADLLLALGGHAFAICHIAHVAHDKCARVTLPGPLYHSPADLVFDITSALLLPGQEPILAGLHTLPSARPLLLACLPHLNLSQALGGVLMRRAQPPGRHDDRLSPIGEGRRVNLAQIYCHDSVP